MSRRTVTAASFAAIVLTSWLGPANGFTTGNETLLRTALLKSSNYDVSVRPDQTTAITLGLMPTSLNSIDIKAQSMSMSGWWMMSWTDSRLTWDPSKYDSISETHVFEDDVWSPSIVVYNSVNDLSAIDEDTIPLRLLSTGQLQWSPPSILTVNCVTDITHFPFDTQTCGISVKSFGYTIGELELRTDTKAVDLSYFSPSGEWSLLRTWAEEVNNLNYSQVVFSFKFERKPEFYGLNMILPVVIMSIISVFTFVLPAESGEKMGFSLTVLLAFIVLMTLLADKMPSTADHTSLFEVYVILALTLCALSVVLSIINLHFYFKYDHHVIPSRAFKVTRFFLRLLGKQAYKTSDKVPNKDEATSLQPEKALRGQSNRSIGSDAHVEQEVTWRVIAKVMDAFLFRVYIVVVVLFTVSFLGIIASN